MMRSVFSAISGLRNHQTLLDVVGNNIANVNTTAFKMGRVVFQDILSQTIRGASTPSDTRGGINPAQIGLGMTVGGIDTISTQGNHRLWNQTRFSAAKAGQPLLAFSKRSNCSLPR